MAFGDVFFQDTPHAIGKGPYHLHIAEDDYLDPHLLLFISTDDYLHDLPIARVPHHKFRRHDSHISFGTVVPLERLRWDKKVDVLSPTMYEPLLDAANSSLTLEHKAKLIREMQVAVTKMQIAAMHPLPTALKPIVSAATQPPVPSV